MKNRCVKGANSEGDGSNNLILARVNQTALLTAIKKTKQRHPSFSTHKSSNRAVVSAKSAS